MFVPTNVLQGLNAMLFFYIGNLSASHKVLDYPVKPLIVVGAVATAALSMYLCPSDKVPMSIVGCEYQFWPLNVITALLCTYSIYLLSSVASKNIRCARFLSYFGRISLLVLCIHNIDLNYGSYLSCSLDTRFLHTEGWQHDIFVLSWCLIVALLGSWMLAKNKHVKKLFLLSV